MDHFPSRQLCVAATLLMANAVWAKTKEGPDPSAKAPTGQPRYLVKVVAASIDAESPEHKPWHTEEPKRFRLLLEGVAAFYQISAVSAVVGAVAGPDRTGRSVPPSPMVQVRIGDKVIESPPIRTTLRPMWNWSFELDTREHGLSDSLSIIILDDDGGGVLGKYQTTVGKLIESRAPQVDVGSVKALQLSVSELGEPAKAARFQFSVPANLAAVKKLNDAQSTAANLWHPIEVLNGDVLRVSATGRVKVKFQRLAGSEPLGPDGRESSMGFTPRLLEGCRDAQGGALVAIVSGKCLPIGAKREIRMEGTSGRLLFLVNDSDVLGENEGKFDVTAEVIPPSLQSHGPTPAAGGIR